MTAVERLMAFQDRVTPGLDAIGEAVHLAKLENSSGEREEQVHRRLSRNQSAKREFLPALTPRSFSEAAAPSYLSEWSATIEQSLKTWESWEVPVAKAHPFWSAPGPYEEVGRHSVQTCGQAPYLLSLLAAQPKNGQDCQLISVLAESFLLWDNWLKRYGSAEEHSQLSIFFTEAGSSLASAKSFPKRLSSKFPLKVDRFCASLDELSGSVGGGNALSRWRSQYLKTWAVYSQDGLRLHRKINQQFKSNQAIDSAEFLTYRALVSGVPQLALLSLGCRRKAPLHDSEIEQLLPLLGLASMLVSIFSDLHLSRRNRQKQSASVSSLEAFDDEWAAMMHTALLALFNSEADAILEQESRQKVGQKGRSSSLLEFTSMQQLVQSLKACLHGICVWYSTAAAFHQTSDGAVEQEAFPFARMRRATSQRLLEDDLGCESETLVIDSIDAAVENFVSILKGSL